MTAARELLAAATPRPWKQDGGTWYTPNGYHPRNWIHDSALIVAAVNEYEALLVLETYVRCPDAENERLAGEALDRLAALRRGDA